MRPKTGVRISFEVLVESKQNSSYADSRRVYIIAAESVRFERVSQAEISSPISVVLCIGVIVNNDNAHAQGRLSRVKSIGLGFLSVLHLFVLTKANLLVPFFDFAYFVVFVFLA